MRQPTEIILVAMTERRVIGCEGGLPWHLPEDLRLFRQITMGQAVVMGRSTFTSIGHPLPGRHNLVVSSTLPPQPGIILCADFSRAVATAATLATQTFYMGGRSIYRQALDRADALYISWVKRDYPGEVLFPSFSLDQWQLLSSADYGAFVHNRYLRTRISDAEALP